MEPTHALEFEGRRVQAHSQLAAQTADVNLDTLSSDKLLELWPTAAAWREMDPLAGQVASGIENTIGLRHGIDIGRTTNGTVVNMAAVEDARQQIRTSGGSEVVEIRSYRDRQRRGLLGGPAPGREPGGRAA